MICFISFHPFFFHRLDTNIFSVPRHQSDLGRGGTETATFSGEHRSNGVFLFHGVAADTTGIVGGWPHLLQIPGLDGFEDLQRVNDDVDGD